MSLIDSDDIATLTSTTAEQDLVIIQGLGGSARFLPAIILDLSELTKNTTFKVYVSLNQGSTWIQRADLAGQIGTVNWTTSDGDCLQIPIGILSDNWVRITAQSSVAEGADRSVPYGAGYEA